MAFQSGLLSRGPGLLEVPGASLCTAGNASNASNAGNAEVWMNQSIQGIGEPGIQGACLPGQAYFMPPNGGDVMASMQANANGVVQAANHSANLKNAELMQSNNFNMAARMSMMDANAFAGLPVDLGCPNAVITSEEVYLTGNPGILGNPAFNPSLQHTNMLNGLHGGFFDPRASFMAAQSNPVRASEIYYTTSPYDPFRASMVGPGVHPGSRHFTQGMQENRNPNFMNFQQAQLLMLHNQAKQMHQGSVQRNRSKSLTNRNRK